MENSPCGASRETKATRLNEAIKRVESISSQLQDFVDRIADEGRPKEATCDKQKQPSLFEILSDGPSRIHVACDQIENDINRAGEMLFYN